MHVTLTTPPRCVHTELFWTTGTGVYSQVSSDVVNTEHILTNNELQLTFEQFSTRCAAAGCGSGCGCERVAACSHRLVVTPTSQTR